jgi:hypothetical protein
MQNQQRCTTRYCGEKDHETNPSAKKLIYLLVFISFIARDYADGITRQPVENLY